MTYRFAGAVGGPDRRQVLAILRLLDVAALRAGGRIDLLAGGASNANYLVITPDGRQFVLRVAKSAVERFGLDRWRGADAQRSVASAGLAPPLIGAVLPAGHALAPFCPGPVLDPQRIRQPGMLCRVAETLRGIHDAPAIDGHFSIFDDQRRYAQTARLEGLGLPDDFDELMRHADLAEAVLAGCGITDRLCHNDLQLPNLIVQDDRLVVVDWEFAGMGNPYFDLGGITANAELAPQERGELVEAYFGDKNPVHAARVELMLYMSALREATWGVIAEPVLDLDWDYQAWAADYYDRCRRSIATGLSRALDEAR